MSSVAGVAAKMIDRVVRELYGNERPWWLAPNEKIDFKTGIDLMSDGIRIDAMVWLTEPPWTQREAHAMVDGRIIRMATIGGQKSGLVKVVADHLTDLLDFLRPDQPSDELLSLAMQAIQSPEALEVLADSLLERGAINPYDPHWDWMRQNPAADRATEARKGTLRSATWWARSRIEELCFRKYWSTEPWGPDTPSRRIVRAVNRLSGYGE